MNARDRAGGAPPKVSVVLTVYNQAQYLGDAIESILRQELRDFELIVVDDGSTDDSAMVAQRYGEMVHTIRRENGGLGPARDTGVAAARGEYVAFCDSDDIQHPFRLGAHTALLDAFPEAACVFSELSPYQDGHVLSENLLRTRMVGPAKRPFEELVRASFRTSTTARALHLPLPAEYLDRRVHRGHIAGLVALTHVAWGCTSLYRRAAIRAVGGHPSSLPRAADWHLVSRISKSYEILFLDVPVMLYRQHGGQLTKKAMLGAECVKRMIEEVWQSDPIFYARERAVIDRGLGSAHWQIARAAESEGDWRTAATHYLRSVLVYPRQRLAYVDLARAVLRSHLAGWGR